MEAVGIEQVMVIKTELFHQIGYFQGFAERADRYLDTLLNAQNTTYQPRDQMEVDPSFKQLIPYCIFQHINQDGKIAVFQYRRGSGQGESRLHKKRSLGIGGHISSLDANDHSTYSAGMQRELDEEIRIESTFEQRLVGLINDDENEVGRVHLGIVHLFTMAEPNVYARETDIVDAGFQPLDQIFCQFDEFETWSQICLKSLF